MAQLVWRPIEAPQGSIRDIALAGSNITNSFDRMGQMLRDREAALRQQATGDATAQALMAGTPEELAALRARGLIAEGAALVQERRHRDLHHEQVQRRGRDQHVLVAHVRLGQEGGDRERREQGRAERGHQQPPRREQVP